MRAADVCDSDRKAVAVDENDLSSTCTSVARKKQRQIISKLV